MNVRTDIRGEGIATNVCLLRSLIMMRSELRSILLETSARADYTTQQLRQQAEDVNVDELVNQIDQARKHMAVLSHALDCMLDGTHSHPMQAFLHATECELVANGSPVSDAEFFALLRAWGIMCENASRARLAKPVSSFDQSSQFFNKFMRGE
jgi:hypothetical protein